MGWSVGPINQGTCCNAYKTKGWEKLPEALRTQLSNATIADLSQFPADWPELELLPTAATTAATSDDSNYASVAVAVLATTSRGNVTIISTDTSDNPVVSPNWLLTETDQELAVQGLRRARQIANASGIVLGPEYAPGPQVQEYSQILEYIRDNLASIHHACSTCKPISALGFCWPSLILSGAMGMAHDSNAVVDSEGKVYGVQALRIVDSSAFPLLPPGHPQATVCEFGINTCANEGPAADFMDQQQTCSPRNLLVLF